MSRWTMRGLPRKERQRVYDRNWKLNNPDKLRAKKERYRLKHREAVNARMRQWKKNHPELMRAAAKRYRDKHRVAMNDYTRRYAKSHPDKRRAWDAVKRYRRLGVPGGHSESQWHQLIALHAGCCVYCGERKPLTRDHRLPVIRGGSNDITNILPACQSCNSRKGTKTTGEFLARVA